MKKDITPAIDNFQNRRALIANINSEENEILFNHSSGTIELVKDSGSSFPVYAFPPLIQDIITATNKHFGFPIDYIGSAILFAVSVSIGNTLKVKVKTGFEVNASMYLAMVGNAGANKSHPLTFALKPIQDEDALKFQIYKQAKKAFQISSKTKSSNNESAQLKPHLEKHLVSDFTIEALIEVHEKNARGLGIYVDELAGWFKNFNKYRKGNDMEFWLSAWSGKTIIVDRKSSDPALIKCPFLSVVGTIQNGVLKEIIKDKIENGLLGRMLFAIPDYTQKPYWTETEIDNSLIDTWQAIIKKILGIPLRLDSSGNANPYLLKFSKDAKELLFEWQKDNSDECNDSNDETIKTIISKMDIHVLRLSLIMHTLEWGCKGGSTGPITKEVVKSAIKLVEYYKQSAISIHTNYSIEKQGVQVSNLLQLYNKLPNAFTCAEAVEISKQLNLSESSCKRYLKRERYFKKLKMGHYEKLAVSDI